MNEILVYTQLNKNEIAEFSYDLISVDQYVILFAVIVMVYASMYSF